MLTLPAAGANFAFRAGVLRSQRGFTLIVAQPLRDVAAAGRALQRRLFAAGVVILIGGGAVFWLTLLRVALWAFLYSRDLAPGI